MEPYTLQEGHIQFTTMALLNNLCLKNIDDDFPLFQPHKNHNL